MSSISSAQEGVLDLWDRYPDLHERFELVQLLGEGAGGIVFQVKDRLNDFDEVALKVLLDPHAFDEQTVRRFREELKISQQLCHPSAIRGFEVIETKDTLAFTMEVVRGLDLGKIFKERALTHDDIDYIFTQVLGALRELHGKGVLHRDIKLENIMVSEEGDVKLSDLGLSKQYGIQLTKTGVLLGTAQYLPPEYIRKGRFDARGDIYALGVALFELFYGKRWMVEYSGAEAIEVLLQKNFSFPFEKLSGVPKKYQYIIRKCLAVAVDQRFQSAAEVIDAFTKPQDYQFLIEEKPTKVQHSSFVDDTRIPTPSIGSPQSFSNIFVRAVMILVATTLFLGCSIVASLAIPSVRVFVVNQAYVYRNSIPPKIYDKILKLPIPPRGMGRN
jgi:serine/threonine protein kinase